jgi:hypothetical protein
VITLTSKKDNSEIKYEIEAGAEKKMFLNGGAYELMTLYSDHGRTQGTISQAIFHEGQEKWIFEQGQRVQQVRLTTASPAQQPTMKMSEATENPSTKGNAEPGDPKLTYALVIKNIDAYKGKRVQWYGKRVSFEITGGVTRATFMNVGQWQAGGDMDPFVVQYRSEKEYSEMPGEGWVTGTIKGTHTVGITLTSPSGRETTRPRRVPLLSYPEIEKVAAR